MLPLVGIEPGHLIASDSKSNTILSTLFPLEVAFFSKFYNPNLHNTTRSDSLGFKTKNPKGTINVIRWKQDEYCGLS